MTAVEVNLIIKKIVDTFVEKYHPDKIVQEWFERGKRDLESAKLIYVQKGYFDEVVFLIHQAIEKYLILNKYLLSLFGVSDFRDLQEKLKEGELP